MQELLNSNKMSSAYFFVDDGERTPLRPSVATWRRIMPMLVAIIGLILMATGIYVNRSKTMQKGSGVNGDNSSSLVSGSEFSRKIVMVDISGAVERPGIIKTNNDSRIQDVLISAGGLSAKADRIYISKNINLAQRVFDGMKLYFPLEGEVSLQNGDVVKLTAGNNRASEAGVAFGAERLINLNSATTQELDRLPGVGPVTVSKIIAGRPYQNISDLINYKIVGKSLYEKIKDLVSTN
jgi:competence protein ComEA